MLKRSLAVAVLGMAALVSSASGAKPDPNGRFAFMVGCWRSADGVNTETWSASQGGVFFGYATTVQAGQLASFEQSRIDMRSTNAIYTVQPNGQRPTEFVERQGGVPGGVAFENPNHDYPQRIIYRPGKKKNQLEATISMLDGSRPAEYAWARCK
jgi:hypothetical protein